jgi:hypothetical protein
MVSIFPIVVANGVVLPEDSGASGAEQCRVWWNARFER